MIKPSFIRSIGLLALLLGACSDDGPSASSAESTSSDSDETTTSDSSTSAGPLSPGDGSTTSDPASTTGEAEPAETSESSNGDGETSTDGGETSTDDGREETGGEVGPCEPAPGEELPAGSSCDPLVPTCAADHGCYFQVEGCPFQCVPTWGPGLDVGDECLYLNDCSPGLVCIDAVAFSSCDGPYCCTSYCDLAAPRCPAAATCEPYYAPGTEPPGYEHVGVCIEA